jgi:hypothetical protein
LRPSVSPSPAAGTGNGGGTVPSPGAGGTLASAGNIAANASRVVVPGVVEAEVTLISGAHTAFRLGYTSLGTALERGATRYVPAVGAGLLAGFVVGNLAKEGAKKLGLSEPAAEGTGLFGAVSSGAGLGFAIAGPYGALAGGIGGLVGYGGAATFKQLPTLEEMKWMASQGYFR